MHRNLILAAVCVALLWSSGTPRVMAAGNPAGKLVCVGDSITAGEGVTADQCYVGQLRARAAGSLAVVADGRSGWTTGDYVGHADAVVATMPADVTVVTILLGTNDARSADPPAQVGPRAAAHVERLVNLYRAKAPRATFVLVGPPAVDVPKLTPRLLAAAYGPRTPPALAAVRSAYAAAACRLGFRYVDLSAVPSAGHTIDGIHPDAAGHAQIAAAIWSSLSATDRPATQP